MRRSTTSHTARAPMRRDGLRHSGSLHVRLLRLLVPDKRPHDGLRRSETPHSCRAFTAVSSSPVKYVQCVQRINERHSLFRLFRRGWVGGDRRRRVPILSRYFFWKRSNCSRTCRRDRDRDDYCRDAASPIARFWARPWPPVVDSTRRRASSRSAPRPR